MLKFADFQRSSSFADNLKQRMVIPSVIDENALKERLGVHSTTEE